MVNISCIFKFMKHINNELGLGFKFLLILIFLLIIGVISLSYVFGKVVYPGYMGVRQITLGPSQGYTENGLRPGYHWDLPFYSKIHVLPATVEIMNLHRNRKKYPDTVGTLEVQTTDGSSVDVDVTILYRYFQDKTNSNGGPADLIQNVGNATNRFSFLQTAIINELKKSLGGLSTSEFYDPILREGKVAKALKALNTRLNSYGIKIENILLRRYTYTEQQIDNAIFKKNLQNQEVRLNKASGELSQATADLESVAAEGDEAIKDLKVRSQNEADLIRSEAILYEDTKKAQGDLLVEKAKASIEKLKAGVLAKTQGAQVYVAKELAPLLASLKGGVVGEIDPYNLEDWLKRLGVKDEQNAIKQDSEK